MPNPLNHTSIALMIPGWRLALFHGHRRSSCHYTTLTRKLGLAITPMASGPYKGCSNASLRGSFSQTCSGVLTSPPDQAGPFARVGTLYFDGNGGVTGALSVSQNGM